MKLIRNKKKLSIINYNNQQIKNKIIKVLYKNNNKIPKLIMINKN